EKLIDELGQYIPKNWQGKTKNREELNEFLRAQAALAGEYPFANWTKWGGMADMPLADATGFFSRVKKDGRWYLTDPSGCAFYSVGPDCVGISCDGRIDGLEELLEWVPDDPELVEKMRREWGEVPRGEGKSVSFARANLKGAFGADWKETWRGMVVKQLKAMGMNTLGNWSDPSLFGRMPYVTSLAQFPATRHCIFRDFPDVLSEEYARNAQECARSLAERRDDPWMIGYFLRNEPSWAFVDDLIIADEVLRDGEDSACKAALIERLRAKYGNVEALNAAWNTNFSSFEALRTPIAKASAFSAQALADLRAFSAELVRAYTEIPAAACRKVDPNHMILGMRWAWISDPALVSGWECFDVFSINCYAVDPTYAIERVEELQVDLPVMIGEFHFGALDSGLTATGLEAVATQKDRGRAYRYYCEHAAAHPLSVGCHYFQCYDQFALGRFDGENYNIGLFDVCLKPYREMAEAIRACNEGVYAVHAGKTPPTDDRPESLPMIAY
ncbi:MAG: beta-galactosidase, partial [Eubacteriales bacterium]|nr:beta-galactosidase [Eubacteriales bacterium]